MKSVVVWAISLALLAILGTHLRPVHADIGSVVRGQTAKTSPPQLPSEGKALVEKVRDAILAKYKEDGFIAQGALAHEIGIPAKDLAGELYQGCSIEWRGGHPRNQFTSIVALPKDRAKSPYVELMFRDTSTSQCYPTFCYSAESTAIATGVEEKAWSILVDLKSKLSEAYSYGSSGMSEKLLEEILSPSALKNDSYEFMFSANRAGFSGSQVLAVPKAGKKLNPVLLTLLSNFDEKTFRIREISAEFAKDLQAAQKARVTPTSYWNVFKKKGRSFLVKNDVLGALGETQFTRTEIVGVEKKWADLKNVSWKVRNGQKEPETSSDGKVTFKDFKLDPRFCFGQTLEDGGELELAGKKWKTLTVATVVFNGNQTKTWYSTEFPCLELRSEIRSTVVAGPENQGGSNLTLEEFKD